MLILEMAFVFNKSKQAKSRVSLKKLPKKINHTKVSFYSYERFCGAVVTGQIRFRLHEICQLKRSLNHCRVAIKKIESSNPTKVYYSIFYRTLFLFNPPLTSLF